MASSDVRLVAINPEQVWPEPRLMRAYAAAPPLDVLRERIADAVFKARLRDDHFGSSIEVADIALRVVLGDAGEGADG